MKEFEQILTLADSNNWETREHAAAKLGFFLESNFSKYNSQLKKLRVHKSDNIRRAVVVGLKYFAYKKCQQILIEVVEILELYLDDNSEYVKRNLGQFAIGDALISYAPEEIKKMILRNYKNDNENIKWNIAMIFSAAASIPLYKIGLPIIKKYIYDPNKRIRTASLKAYKNIYIRVPVEREQIKNIINLASKKVILNKKSMSFLHKS